MLPLAISSLDTITLDVGWSYAAGLESVPKGQATDHDQLVSDANLNANVALDMFLAADESESKDSVKATHEVMIWLGMYGLATQPIGYGV